MSRRGDACPVILGIMEVGGKWKLAIVYYLLQGPKTFSELKELLGVNSKILSENLRYLEERGIVWRKIKFPPLRVTYELTDKGRELEEVIEALRRWSEKWIKDNPSEGRG